MEAYHRLEELSAQKERAAALEERNRIARDMHDPWDTGSPPYHAD